MSISRRKFLEATALSGLAATALAGAETDPISGMPKRLFGKTGAHVSILAFGCGSRFLMYKEDDDAVAALESALEQGITYVDTAYGYGDGKSESRVGQLMPKWRKSIWLATKVNARNGDEAMRIIEGSLKRLQTDHVDLLHIHSLQGAKDLAEIEAKGNVLDVVHKMRDQKVARFIGVTSHTDPATLKTALERHDFDCTQMALNAAQAGMTNTGPMQMNPMHDSFQLLALPVALKKNMGVTAMKIFAQEHLSGKAPVDELIRYSMSLPVAAAVVGMPKREYINHNVEVAKAFKPMSKDEMQRLSGELGEHKAALDEFFRNHVDA